MDSAKLKGLRAVGWKAVSVKEFLQLSDDEAMLVELRLASSNAAKASRQKRRPSQIGLAKRMGAKQKPAT